MAHYFCNDLFSRYSRTFHGALRIGAVLAIAVLAGCASKARVGADGAYTSGPAADVSDSSDYSGMTWDSTSGSQSDTSDGMTSQFGDDGATSSDMQADDPASLTGDAYTTYYGSDTDSSTNDYSSGNDGMTDAGGLANADTGSDSTWGSDGMSNSGMSDDSSSSGPDYYAGAGDTNDNTYSDNMSNDFTNGGPDYYDGNGASDDGMSNADTSSQWGDGGNSADDMNGLYGSDDSGTASDDPFVVGTIDTPGDHARVDEEVTPQTLDGMLPLSVGVDEEGHFDFDRAVLRPEVRSTLDALAVRLDGADYDRLDIVGYTDRIGTDEYNQSLSERRAWAVARYLMDKGIPLSKIKVEGRGERNSVLMVTDCAGLDRDHLIACLEADRRVEIEASIRKSHVKLE